VLQPQVSLNDRLLIVGADGFLGRALRVLWRQQKRAVMATAFLPVADAPDTHRLDLSQSPDTWPVLLPGRAAVLCAAITSLEQCRRDPAGTRKVNVEHTLALAQRLAEQGTFVVFLSTNLVFDGTKPLRKADEATCPQTEYGRQKADVEAGLAALGVRHAVVRLAKVFHADLPLVRDWVVSLRAGKSIAPFADMVCAPVALDAVLQGLTMVAENELEGRWQFSPREDVSYATIATEVGRLVQADLSLIHPGSARQFTALEHLPAHTTLDARETCGKLGLDFPDAAAVIAQAFYPCQYKESQQK
jgi:dTDP-4-dehydrorhamnose reductase